MLGNILSIEQMWMNNVKVTKLISNGWSIIGIFTPLLRKVVHHCLCSCLSNFVTQTLYYKFKTSVKFPIEICQQNAAVICTIFEVISETCDVCLRVFLLTISTAVRTRRRFSPRAALTSTSLHPLLSSSATKSGTLDTSSRPSGILRERFYFLQLTVVPYFKPHFLIFWEAYIQVIA